MDFRLDLSEMSLLLGEDSNCELINTVVNICKVQVEVGVLHPVQQPRSYLDSFSPLALVGLEPHRGDSL